MQRFCLCVTLLWALCLDGTGCLAAQSDQSSLHRRAVLQSSPIPRKDTTSLPITEITLEREYGYTREFIAPYELILRSDGTVIKFVALAGKYRAHIAPSAFRQLAQSLLDRDFGNYEPFYGPAATDISITRTSVVYQGRRKEVVDQANGKARQQYEISAPAELNQIEHSIDAAVAHVHWKKLTSNWFYPRFETKIDFYFGDWPIPKNPSQQQLNELLILAIYRQNTAMVKTLLAKGADPNTLEGPMLIALHGEYMQDPKASIPDRHWTALMVATGSGNPTIVRLLLEAGANVNTRNDNGFTALMDAAYHASNKAEQQKHPWPPCAEIVKLLIQHGADVNAKDKDGKTALTEGRKDPEVEALLKQAGAKE